MRNVNAPIHMRLNDNGSFDVKKPNHLSLNLFFSKSIFSFFVQKMDPLTIFTHWIKSDIAILGTHSSEKRKVGSQQKLSQRTTRPSTGYAIKQ